MRLATVAIGGERHIGVVERDDVRIVSRHPEIPADMVELIEGGTPLLDRLREILAVDGGSLPCLPLGEATLLAPIPRPRKNVFAVGLNYFRHVQEGAGYRGEEAKRPDWPVFFSKAPTTVIGPGAPIPRDSRVSVDWDWEVELGVVIGQGGRDIPAEQARSHIFGYTIINDVSVRDLQRRHGGQFFRGKSIDGTCPMGPWIVTADEIAPDQSLRLSLAVNDVVKQDGETSQMIFPVHDIIAHLSLGMTLEPGDVIATGTPDGVGYTRTPPEFLQPGDVVEARISGVGVLRNQVVEKES
ncbi:fumarylacetoacetate hydrolase family protein [Actinopolymorpha alba]|uniref:fumarylacetoacetate hydrolase family protein n=1 Tax=Actinopolymorpha alba TaxID=533267 RepID=UPI00035ED58C|nr:fumarylacetoacetate hydrolase family protein [Actinopolymorpha alba]